MTNVEKFVELGRYMITNAATFHDDATSNNWAAAGQMLTELGTPFAPKLTEFGDVLIQTVREGAAVHDGKLPMPLRIRVSDTCVVRNTRKARMTRVMTKPQVEKATKPLKPVAKVKDSVKRGRGRPRKNA